MPRVTKSVTAKAKHKKVLNSTKKGIMELEADYIKQLSNLILNQCNMHLEIERIKKKSFPLFVDLKN